MSHSVDRRSFLRYTGAAALGLAVVPALRAAESEKQPLFSISLAQWSLHRAFFEKDKAKALDPLKFAEIAKKDYDINAVEYVNQFYAAKKKDDGYLKDLKKVATDNGVTSVLIMCDGEGNLGDPDEKKRATAVANHVRWIEWAVALGCHSIRVNAASDWAKGFEETQKLAADGLGKLGTLGEKSKINVIVENHGGLSSHGEWLAGVMKLVGSQFVGTLPDFGNFNIGKIDKYGPTYDRYKGVDELMPFAKGVSAKTYDFDDKGNEKTIDYRKLLEIVLKKHKYTGYLGIEYEGGKMTEAEGIRATKKLLETIRTEMSK